MQYSPLPAPSTLSIAPFSFEVGDHQAFIVDFQLDSLLGDEFVPIAKPEIRHLISSQEQSVYNYINRGEELFNHHKVSEKIERLSSNQEKYTLTEREKALNKIDKEVTKLLISTERSCRKLRTRAVAYSPELLRLGLTQYFWRKLVQFK